VQRFEPTAPAYFVDESGKIQKILLGDRPGWNHGAKAALKAGKLLAGGYVYCHLKGKHADPAAIVKSHGGPSLDHVPPWKTRKAGLKTYKICCEGRHYTASSEFEAAVLSHQGQLVLVHKSCNSAAQAHGFRADVDTASLCKLVEKCPGDTCTLLKAYAFLDDAKKGGGREGKRTKGVSGIDQSVTVTLYYEDGNLEHRTFN